MRSFSRLKNKVNVLRVDDLLGKLPRSIIAGAQKVLESIYNDLKEEKKVVKTIGDNENFRAIFTDGSNVISERRGAAIALFSATSLVYDYYNGSKKVLATFELDPAKTLFIFIPKFAVTSRANTLMRAFEYVVTINALSRSSGVDYIVLDGSYISTLLDPMRIISPIYHDLVDVFSGKKDLLIKILFDLENELKLVIKNLESAADASSIIDIFINNYYSYIDQIIANFDERIPENAKITFHNYVVSVLEQSFAVFCLSKLFEIAKKFGVAIIWLSKDSESRILAKNYSAFSLLNDISILDFLLDTNEYLILNDLIEIPPIDERRMKFIERQGTKEWEIYVIPRELTEAIYSECGAYTIVYAKFSDFAIQFSYPTTLNKQLNLTRFLVDLRNISDLGYPEPLIIVHNRTVLRQKLIENLSEGLYEKCREKGDSIICNIIGDRGRRKIGI